MKIEKNMVKKNTKYNYEELKRFRKEFDSIAQIAVLFPCKKDKLYEELKAKYAHLINDENLPDQNFDKDYEKRYN